MSTAKNLAHPISELIGGEQTVGLYHFSLAVNPFGLYGVQPRTLLLGQKTADDLDPTLALFDLAVVFSEPSSTFLTPVPAGVVPHQKQNLLAEHFELLAAPQKKLRRYSAHRPTVYEAQPRLTELCIRG